MNSDRQECVLWIWNKEFLLLSRAESHSPGRLNHSVSPAQILDCACVRHGFL